MHAEATLCSTAGANASQDLLFGIFLLMSKCSRPTALRVSKHNHRTSAAVLVDGSGKLPEARSRLNFQCPGEAFSNISNLKPQPAQTALRACSVLSIKHISDIEPSIQLFAGPSGQNGQHDLESRISSGSCCRFQSVNAGMSCCFGRAVGRLDVSALRRTWALELKPWQAKPSSLLARAVQILSGSLASCHCDSR